MKRCLLIALLIGGCHRTPPAWPADLTADLTRIELRRGPRLAQLQRAPDGMWMATAPHHGEGDLRAINALLGTLQHPQLTSAARGAGEGEVATSIVLEGKAGRHTVEVMAVPLGRPVPLVVDGRARFLGSPVELSTKIPDPDDMVANGLWMSAEHLDTLLTVTGPLKYSVRRTGPESFESSIPAHPGVDLEDFVGAITGRQIIAFPPAGPPSQFGLDAPVCTAELCAGATCRTFRFGQHTDNGVRRAYAQAPGVDVAEIRSEVLALLLRGP